MRKKLYLTDEELESIKRTNKAKNSVYKEFFKDVERSFLQGFEIFLRKIRTEEVVVNFVLQKYKSSFETCKIPPGKHEVDDIKTTLYKFKKSSCPNKLIARISRLKTKKFTIWKKLFQYINWI